MQLSLHLASLVLLRLDLLSVIAGSFLTFSIKSGQELTIQEILSIRTKIAMPRGASLEGVPRLAHKGWWTILYEENWCFPQPQQTLMQMKASFCSNHDIVLSSATAVPPLSQ